MEPQVKKIRMSGGARCLMKEKEKAVKGNQSILMFLKPNDTLETSTEHNCSEEEDNPLTLPSIPLGMYLNCNLQYKIIRFITKCSLKILALIYNTT